MYKQLLIITGILFGSVAYAQSDMEHSELKSFMEDTAKGIGDYRKNLPMDINKDIVITDIWYQDNVIQGKYYISFIPDEDFIRNRKAASCDQKLFKDSMEKFNLSVIYEYYHEVTREFLLRVVVDKCDSEV